MAIIFHQLLTMACSIFNAAFVGISVTIERVRNYRVHLITC